MWLILRYGKSGKRRRRRRGKVLRIWLNAVEYISIAFLQAKPGIVSEAGC